MQADELKTILDELGWKQTHLAQRVGVRPATVSAWATGSPIPPWVSQYLGMVQEVDRLHRLYVRPPKPMKEFAPPVQTPAPRTETRAAAMVRTLKKVGHDDI